MSKIITLEETFKPISWLNRIFGLTIFEMPTGQSWPKFSIFYALSRSVIYGILFYADFAKVDLYAGVITVMILVYQVILILNVIIAGIGTVLGLINYKNVKKHFKRIKNADETIKIFGIDPEYEKEANTNLKIVLMWFFGACVAHISDLSYLCFSYNFFKAFLRTIVYEIPFCINTIVELNFAVFVSIVGKRFERLNAILKNISTPTLETHSNRDDVYQEILKKNQNKTSAKAHYYYKNRNNLELVLRTARQLHLDLCATCREVNDSCGKQLSLQLVALFCLLTGFSYCFYIIFNEPLIDPDERLRHYASILSWIILSGIRIICVIYVTVKVMTEAEKTSRIAHEIQMSTTQHRFREEARQLSLQITQHPLYFSASGLISLDFTYIRGLVGSITTYLIILIQNQAEMVKAADKIN